MRSTPIRQQSLNGVHFFLESTYASLLIPLNLCRKQKLYKPWECEHERHTYDKYVYYRSLHLMSRSLMSSVYVKVPV